MDRLRFADLIELVNCTDFVFINPEPTRTEAGWSVYSAEYRVPMESFEFEILYINSRATRDDVLMAAREHVAKSKGNRTIRVIHDAPSSALRVMTRQVFANRTKGVWEPREYLYSLIEPQVKKYRSALRRPDYYVSPPVELRSTHNLEGTTDLVDLHAKTDDTAAGSVEVLLAAPGQGKTCTSEHLAAELTKTKDIIPILVISDHWKEMSPADVSSIWKTIVRCFEFYGARIPWLAGSEEQFLRATLKADLCRIVFDGFDEYVLHNKPQLNAKDVLGSLVSLAANTGAKILVTSRTAFWDNAFETDSDVPPNVRIHQIRPFRERHATKYFSARFNNNPLLIPRAVSVFNDLHHENAEFAGRGFVLPLITDLVAAGDASTSRPSTADVAHWLFQEICNREARNHELPIDSRDQLRALAYFAAEVAAGREPDTKLLQAAFGTVTGLRKETIENITEKIKIHPLITYSQATNQWTFNQQQVAIILLADALLDSGIFTTSLISSLRLDAAARQDLAAAIVSALMLRPPDVMIVEARKLITAVRGINGDGGAGCHTGVGPRLAGALLLALLDAARPGNDRDGRTDLLLELSAHERIRGLLLSGSIARLDLRNVTFVNCTFEGATFIKCQFAETTLFERCLFIGGTEPEFCTRFGAAHMLHCEPDETAMKWMAAVRSEHRAREYSDRELESDVRTVARKFVIKGGLRLKPVAVDLLMLELAAPEKVQDEIVDAMVREQVIEIKRHDDGHEEYIVHTDARDAMHFFARNNVLTGPLRATLSSLKKRLHL
jgi:NACHT domain